MADEWDNLRIIDVSEPASPSDIAVFPGVQQTRSIFIEDNLGYVACEYSRFNFLCACGVFKKYGDRIIGIWIAGKVNAMWQPPRIIYIGMIYGYSLKICSPWAQ